MFQTEEKNIKKTNKYKISLEGMARGFFESTYFFAKIFVKPFLIIKKYKESSKYIIQSGYYCLLTCVPFILFETGKAAVWIAIILATLYPFISIIQTEKALKKKFG